MWPSINTCFPDPLAAQWPATQHPVLCECRQLYVLVSLCCCVPGAHLLVLHDGAGSGTATSMPKGPTYLELRLTEHTRRDAFCGFLARAEAAATGTSNSTTNNNNNNNNNSTSNNNNSISTTNNNNNSNICITPTMGGTTANATTNTSNGLGFGGGSSMNGHPTVVCVHDIAAASPPVLAALLDVLLFGLVRVTGTVRAVPSLRIVAFCDARAYAAVLPEHVRSAFALSTYMSSLAMESAAVIQSADTQSSNVVNKRHMLEVMLAPDGAALIDTVTLSAEVIHYLRHLILVLRGSMLKNSAPGSYIPTRIPRMLRMLRVVALLFAPSACTRMGGKSPMSLRPATPTSYQHYQDHGNDSEPITSFAHVVVSPAHVMCLLCPMVAHLFSLRREMTALSCHNPNDDNTKSETCWCSVKPESTAVDMWDAKAVRWLSHLDGVKDGGSSYLKADDTMRSDLPATRDVQHAMRELGAGMLSYTECRELIRATIMRRSSPPIG